MEKRNSISDSFVFDFQSKIDLFKTIINTFDNANDVRYNIVRQNIAKSSRFIEGTFILYPHLAKISFNTNFIDPVASYKSLSGKTWEFSRLFDGEKLDGFLIIALARTFNLFGNRKALSSSLGIRAYS